MIAAMIKVGASSFERTDGYIEATYHIDSWI